MPDGQTAARDYIQHVGSVAAVAVDGQERVVLVRQYRHPLRRVLWELPAGLRDVDDEDPALTAARELAEEAGLVAARWEPLLTLHNSPGYSNEQIHIYLAQELDGVDDGFEFERVFEESTMTTHLVPLDEAIAMVDRGEITNATTVAGLLAAWRRLRTAAPPA
ncbi:MAG: NUDIX hydrolase [Micromonosporaceae bacterium]|nr:NUDIX hydrolase [Micromonosporaceae bacterium]